MEKAFSQKRIWRITHTDQKKKDDTIVIEEPLQIILEYYDGSQYIRNDLVMTMRTPGDDRYLVIGFLLSEGIIQSIDDVQFDGHIGILEPGAKARNRYLVSLKKEIKVLLDQKQRYSIAHSSCGICGKRQIAMILKNLTNQDKKEKQKLDPKHLYHLHELFNQAHQKEDQTGAMHSAASFNDDKELTAIAFDVGRHNALDKMIGEKLIKRTMPSGNEVLLLSGRVSYEMAQKAICAGFDSIIALGAPTSLAIELAEESHINLVGFLKNNQMNIYH